MTFASEMLALASRMLAKYGTSATLTTYAPVADDVAGTVTQNPTNTTVLATPPLPVLAKFVNGDTIRASDTDSWLAASGLAVTPVAGSLLTFAGSVWRVVSVGTYHVATGPAAHQLFLRAQA